MHKQHSESEELKATIANKLKQMEKDYIKIADHEKIVNEEVMSAQKNVKQKIKEIKERSEKEVKSELASEWGLKFKESEKNLNEYKRMNEEINGVNFELKKTLREKADLIEEVEWRNEKHKKAVDN